MRLLDARMSRASILKLLAPLAATLIIAAQVEAQDGPAVQVFTSSNGGGAPVLMPLEQLPVGVSVSVSAGYDTNVGTTSVNDQGSFYSSASLGLTYSFGTERTRVNLNWGTGITYYDNGAGAGFNDYQPDTSLSMSISHQVSERLTLNSGIYAHFGIEPDFASGAGENRRSGNYFYTSDSISASYQWLERLSTVTTYSIGILKYEDEAQSALLDRSDHGISQQFRFLLLPMTTLVAQYGFNLSTYDQDNTVTINDGMLQSGRDSRSHSFSLGVEQTLGPRLQGSLHAGAQLFSSDQEVGDTWSPYGSGSLSFVVGEKTSLTWTAQYSTQVANISGASSRQSFSSGLQLSYAVTPRISSSLSAYYSHSDYKGQRLLFFDPTRFIIFFAQPSFTEDTFDFGVNLSYSITPRMSANFDAHYSDASSGESFRPYSRARFSGGISYSF